MRIFKYGILLGSLNLTIVEPYHEGFTEEWLLATTQHTMHHTDGMIYFCECLVDYTHGNILLGACKADVDPYNSYAPFLHLSLLLSLFSHFLSLSYSLPLSLLLSLPLSNLSHPLLLSSLQSISSLSHSPSLL